MSLPPHRVPLVTIAIPTYNRADYLIQAISSALAQTHHNIEIIVSDNASTDNTHEIVKQFTDIRLVSFRHETSLGMEGNWNFCLSKAKGDFFILLSDDDFLEPNAIRSMMVPFVSDESQSIGMVYCRSRIINTCADDAVVTLSAPENETASNMILSFLNNERAIYPCSTLLRTADIKELGGYDIAKFSCALDAAVWTQAALKRGKVAFINDVLSNYRVHSGNLTQATTVEVWVGGIENVIAACCDFYLNKNEPATIAKVRKLGSRYTALFVDGLIRANPVGASKFGALKMYMAFAKYFFASGLKRIWVKRLLGVMITGMRRA